MISYKLLNITNYKIPNESINVDNPLISTTIYDLAII